MSRQNAQNKYLCGKMTYIYKPKYTYIYVSGTELMKASSFPKQPLLERINY